MVIDQILILGEPSLISFLPLNTAVDFDNVKHNVLYHLDLAQVFATQQIYLCLDFG